MNFKAFSCRPGDVGDLNNTVNAYLVAQEGATPAMEVSSKEVNVVAADGQEFLVVTIWMIPAA